MKLELEVKDSKVDFLLELLKNFSFVKVKEDKKTEKELLIEELKESAEFMKLVNQGKAKGRPIKEVLDEL